MQTNSSIALVRFHILLKRCFRDRTCREVEHQVVLAVVDFRARTAGVFERRATGRSAAAAAAAWRRGAASVAEELAPTSASGVFFQSLLFSSSVLKKNCCNSFLSFWWDRKSIDQPFFWYSIDFLLAVMATDRLSIPRGHLESSAAYSLNMVWLYQRLRMKIPPICSSVLRYSTEFYLISYVRPLLELRTGGGGGVNKNVAATANRRAASGLIDPGTGRRRRSPVIGRPNRRREGVIPRGLNRGYGSGL